MINIDAQKVVEKLSQRLAEVELALAIEQAKTDQLKSLLVDQAQKYGPEIDLTEPLEEK